MKLQIHLLLVSGLLFSIAGCSPEPVEETVWDDQIKTLDKARDVEETLMNRADQLAKDLEDKDEENPPH